MSDDPRLVALEERRVANIGKQVDNAALPAGSPMFYYCNGCGVETAVKEEGWYTNPPPWFCQDCRPLHEEGLIGSGRAYDEWLVEHGEKPVPH